MEPLTIGLDCPTRWASTHDMIEKYVYLKNPIRRFENDNENELAEFKLTDVEWELTEILLVFLMPFKRCTRRFEDNSEKPEIDYVFFGYDELYNHLDDVKAALGKNTGLGARRSVQLLLQAIEQMEKELKK